MSRRPARAAAGDAIEEVKQEIAEAIEFHFAQIQAKNSEALENMNPLISRISIDPNICFGKPCIRGTRIWVSLILDFLAGGMSFDEVIAEYPQLTEEDIRAAIAYGAEMTRARFVDLPIEAA